MISLIKDITVSHSVMSWNDIASVAYSTESSLASVCYTIHFDTSVSSNIQILWKTHESTLLIYIQILSKWWKETMNTQSTVKGIVQMNGLYKHQVIGMAWEHTGMRGWDWLSIGHASGRNREGVKPGLVGLGVLWEQSRRYCLAMQRGTNWRPSLLHYNSLQLVHPSLIFSAIL